MKNGAIVYYYGHNLYINLTNRCPNACDFCIRNFMNSLGDADSLWLEEEPSAEQVLTRLKEEICQKNTPFQEIIFCGYGEPTERLDTVLEIAGELRKLTDKPIRINTNGMADLIHKKRTAPMFKGLIDVVSVSLNASTAEEYNQICHPKFGVEAYDAILKWSKDVSDYVPQVVMSVVDVIPEEEIEACRKIAESVGVSFKVRHEDK